MKRGWSNMWVGMQIDTTKLEHIKADRKRILEEKVSLAKQSVGLDALLIWAHGDPKSIDTLCELCAGMDIETYLWYPILADIPDFEIPQNAKVENYEGRRGYGEIGRWQRLGTYASGREKFEFLCPNSEETVSQIFNLYKNQLKRHDFDGVFLDRIRYPSAAMGFEILFSCFCDNCKRMFKQQFNMDLKYLKSIVEAHFGKRDMYSIDLIKNAGSLHEILFPDEMRDFLIFKNRSVYKVVKKFSDYAKTKGKKVGLDLFSHSLAGAVSQDYELLSTACDWIKPMIYCHSTGPAGFPLELHSIIHSLLTFNRDLKQEDVADGLSDILGVKLPATLNLLMTNGIPEEMIFYEIKNINGLNLKSGVDIYPGFEVMKMDDLCVITDKILESYLDNVFAQKAKGMVMAWDLLDMPDENVDFTERYLREHTG